MVDNTYFLNDIYPLEWFEDFDKLPTGRVSKDQFRRCFEFIKFKITDEELNALTNLYGENDDVNYRKFCHTIENIFTNQDLEKSPTQNVENSKEIIEKTTGKITQDISPELNQLFLKLYHQVKTRGVHVRESYMDFDRLSNGRVTVSQFLRNNPFINLSSDEMSLLLQRYMDPTLHDVNYMKLHHDLQMYSDLPQNQNVTIDLNMPHHQQSIKLNPVPSNTSDVIQRFATYCRKNRVRIRDFFSFQDPLHIGKITTDKFMNVLTLYGFPFSQEELLYLSDKYQLTEGYTKYDNYRDFCNDVEIASKKSDVNNSNISIVTDKRISQIIEKIKSIISRNRINILPPFHDFDQNNRGYVTNLQFKRVLSSLRIPFDDNDLNLLIDYYGKEVGFDYYKFVEDVDVNHQQQRRTYKPLLKDKESLEEIYGKTPTGDLFITSDKADDLIYESKKILLPKLNEKFDINSLLDDMKRYSYIHSIYFSDFLKDFDKLNLGEITETQFRSGILMSGYRLTNQEFDMLKERYKSTKSKNYIKWKVFADEILSFISPKNISPLETPQNPLTITCEKTKLKPNQNINRILNIINKFIISRKISLVDQFKDKDIYNHKQITINAFYQVMQLVGVNISYDEIQQLCSFYLDKNTGFVNYIEFINDVNSLNENKNDNLNKENVTPRYVKKPLLTARQIQWNVILPKLQNYIYKRRIRIIDFFENFDHLNHGTITSNQFRSIVGQINLPLNEDEIQFITKLFCLETKPDLINYRELCKQINAIFENNEIQNQNNLQKISINNLNENEKNYL